MRRILGIQSAHILRLWNLTLVVCSVVFALVLLAMLAAIVRQHSRNNDDAPHLSALSTPERRTRRLVTVVRRISVVALVGLIVADVLTDRARSMLPAENPVLLFAVPVMQAVATYLVPLMIGARSVAFPRMNAYAYGMFLLGGLTLYIAFVPGAGPRSGSN